MPDALVAVDALESVLSKTAAIIDGAGSARPTDPTPCPGYDVGGLVGHMVTQIDAFAAAAEGGDSGSAAAGDSASPHQRFASAGARAVAAFRGGATERTVTLGSQLPGSSLLAMMIMEYIAHGWDLATATGQRIAYVDAEAQIGLDAGRAMLKPEYRGDAFGPEVPVPDDAGTVPRLLGFMGRDPLV